MGLCFKQMFKMLTGVDPVFLVGGGASPPTGAPTYDFAKFSEKLHEIKKILGRRGRVPGVPPWIRHWLTLG